MNLLDKNFIVLIDKDGSVITIPRRDSNDTCLNHRDAYSRLPGLVDTFDAKAREDFDKSSGGYEKARVLAAYGYVVIWPTDINNPEFILGSIPTDITLDQSSKFVSLLDELGGKSEYYLSSYKLKSLRSNKIIQKNIGQEMDYNNFCSLVKMIDSNNRKKHDELEAMMNDINLDSNYTNINNK